jgi:hypothetical protein
MRRAWLVILPAPSFVEESAVERSEPVCRRQVCERRILLLSSSIQTTVGLWSFAMPADESMRPRRAVLLTPPPQTSACLKSHLSPFLATHPEDRQVSPLFATLPNLHSRKPFVCHTYDTPPGCSPVGGLTSYSLAYILPRSVYANSFVCHSYESCRGGGLLPKVELPSGKTKGGCIGSTTPSDIRPSTCLPERKTATCGPRRSA